MNIVLHETGSSGVPECLLARASRSQAQWDVVVLWSGAHEEPRPGGHADSGSPPETRGGDWPGGGWWDGGGGGDGGGWGS